MGFAGRIFNRKQALEKEIKDLHVKFTRTAGNPVIDSGKGIASVTESGTGEYTITLQDKYASLKHVEARLMKSTESDIRFQIKSQAVSTSKTIVLFALTDATATDLADGDTVFVSISVKNTAQPD